MIMALKIRLARGGTKKRPHYRIVVADVRAPRDGRFLEKIGAYDPLISKDDPRRVVLQEDRARYWYERGARPTDRVARFLDAAGIATRTPRNNPQKAKPRSKTLERIAAKEAAAAAAAEAPAEEAAPAEETPAEEATPTEETPVEETPAKEASAEEAPAEEAPAEETPAEDPPAEESSSKEESEK